MSRRSALPLGALLAIAACSRLIDAGQREQGHWVRVVGQIEFGGQEALRTPDAVARDSDFTITVSTYGSTGCVRPDRSDVQYGQSSIDVTVYDSIWASVLLPCTPDIHEYPRTLELRFDAAGPALIRLHGLRGDSALTIERSISVRP